MDSEPSIGYIGLDNRHREKYIRCISHLPGEITCVCEPDQSFDIDSVSDGKILNVPLYSDPTEMLDESNVDIVFITYSNKHTPSIVESAVKRDIDVYCEKPMARTSAELEAVANSIDESNATVCVSYLYRSHPVSKDMRLLAKSGFFGDITALEANFIASDLKHRDTSHYIYDKENSRGGILQWLGVHYIDLLRWVLDEPFTKVNANISHNTPEVDTEDAAMIQLETQSGAIATIHAGYYLRDGCYDTNINIYGSEGRASWDPMGKSTDYSGSTQAEIISFTDKWSSAPRRVRSYDYNPDPPSPGKWTVNFIEQFYNARSSKCSVPATVNDALKVLKILDAAYTSADESKWVSIESI